MDGLAERQAAVVPYLLQLSSLSAQLLDVIAGQVIPDTGHYFFVVSRSGMQVSKLSRFSVSGE